MSNKRILETSTEPCARAVGVFHSGDKQVVSLPLENRQYVHPDNLSSTMSPAGSVANVFGDVTELSFRCSYFTSA